MATYYRNDKLTTGDNDGSTPLNAWRDQTTMYRDLAPLVAGDVVEYMEDSGPYFDAFSTDIVNRRDDISFDSASNEIRTAGGDFSIFSAGQFIKVITPQGVSGDSRNRGLFEIASVTSSAITVVATHTLYDESAGNATTVTAMDGFRVSAFDIRWNGSAGTPITYDLKNNLIHGGVSVDGNSGLAYFPSGLGDDEYYVARLDGSNPGFRQVKSALLDGNHMIESTGYDPELGTVGSLTEGFAGWGASNGLPFDTIYIKKSVTPTVVNTTLDIAQLEFAADTIWQDLKWTSTSYDEQRPMGRIGHFNTGATNNVSLTGEWIAEDIAITYTNWDAFRSGNAGGAGSVTRAKKCVGFKTGHRFGNINFPGDIILENCVDIMPHLSGFIGSTATASNEFAITNHIGINNEAGSIDKVSAAAVLTETYNHFYPLMLAAGGDLGYVNPSNWSTTDATDNPSNTLTNKNATGGGLGRANYPELEDPRFVNITGVYEECDFRLQAGSPCINTGTPIAGITLDAAGNPYDPTNPNKGIYAGFVSFGPSSGQLRLTMGITNNVTS